MASGQRDTVLREIDRVFNQGPIAGTADGQLLHRFVARRDEVAFEALVALHGPMVLGVCRRRLRDPHDVEDAFQATFLVLVRRAGALREVDQLGPWLHGVALRVAGRARGAAARQRERDRRGARAEAVGHDTGLLREELRRAIDEEIDRLPEKYRRPVVLCDLEGRTVAEAARRLRSTEGSVRGRLDRARQRLRSRLSRRGVAPALGLAGAGLTPEAAAVAVPPALASAAVACARSASTHGRLAAAAVPASVITLAEGVLRVMLLSKLKLAAPLVAAGVLLVAALPLAVALGDPPARPPAQSKGAEPAPPRADRPPDASPKALELRVVDERTDGPLPGVAVRAEVDWRPRADGTTDERGQFRFSLPDGEPTAVDVRVKKDGFVPVVLTWDRRVNASEFPGSYTLGLEPTTAIGGLVLDEEGRPVEGATVSVTVPANASRGPGRVGLEDLPVKTDAQGRWLCDLVPARLDDVWLRVAHPDYVSDSSDAETPRPRLAQLRDRTGVMVLKRGVAVSGRVLDLAGRPIAGAHVAQGSDRRGPTHHPETRTDPQGRFTFAHVRPGQVVLTVRAEGHAPDLKRVAAGPGARPIEFRLGPGRTIRGRVVDPDERPVVAASVAATTWRGHSSLDVRLETDAEGRFRWDEAPDDPVMFSVHRKDFRGVMQRALAPSDGETTIRLDRPQTVRGRVRDAETGEPVESFTLLTGVDWEGSGQRTTLWRHPARPSPGGRYEVRLGEAYPRQFLRIEAEGYRPAVSRVIKNDEGDLVLDFTLRRGAWLAGVVRLPDGSPLAGADVALITPDHSTTVHNGRVLLSRRDPGVATTGPDGRFAFPRPEGTATVLVVHERGVAVRSAEQLAEGPDVRLGPWARIEGTLRTGGKPAAYQEVGAYLEWPDEGRGLGNLTMYTSTTDAEGRFVIERVFPGELTVHRTSHRSESGSLWTHLVQVDVPPGGTVQVALGGGRPLVGRVVGPGGTALRPDLVNQNSLFSTRQEPPPTPPDFATFDAVRKQQWLAAFRKTEEGKAYFRGMNRIEVAVHPDGTFRAEDVPPGRYDLRLALRAGGRGDAASTVATALKEVVVPEAKEGGGEPFDVGTVELSMKSRRRVDVGDAAPPLEIKSLDGEPVRLADLRGKYVLLDFWATWCLPCLEETPHLKATFQAFGKDDRLVMLGLSLDQAEGAVRRYVAEQGVAWTQGLLGDWAKAKIPDDYGVQGIPSIWLIGPDGKVVAKDLRGEAIQEAVARALAGPSSRTHPPE